MGSHYEAPIRKPLVTGNKSYHQISVDVARPIEGVANKKWWIVFGISLILFMWGIGCIIYTIYHLKILSMNFMMIGLFIGIIFILSLHLSRYINHTL